MCVPLTEMQFTALKIANNVIHCVTHAVPFSTGVIDILFRQRFLKLVGMHDDHIFCLCICVYSNYKIHEHHRNKGVLVAGPFLARISAYEQKQICVIQ